ncbi:MAG: bifunctional tRNA (5-methylaminomethyl-2-thiouridine)(34)-methyltransferase MnmD/FAD-dependent 5-carboxymethylaminomethyl-2-thiouridine(34) oxidoreductase MnmC [Aliidiomarina sp.]|uniref:bifunctional tRNA (5-methylaminomethyl-2-thiouridine)(34)-methyltransferase MnmD/FAD-dependent 5-carboxymethylaminomethyl-2-thiouridine(34) oxidoreductase MnmC n=1 Tax=Aliidiomarina sp. TaxID=1872439 RepID=UPI0025C5CD49|nr:bifunctional tRNA (5-methylaminomethyl-2-thiouridine)(34)-methyltransferase MnmD/FAD-dependent 5-carboxymethylaminomethyl-2-thiouridine(34) oxidoreductase MnmC [Aliidiomarina sp.]MCH8501411.1 bifunctional tRNA (5-methylaminomethyl-2-thiouridine)(34)-methyltransferase MnmD/FAD-dependent 5-carboxymethylaminomethyl-2-thiouridine(34) oxidoreductase MnmC [Aliidiomarina sp.]
MPIHHNDSTSLEFANIHFDDAGVPESHQFGDIYFSRDNGLAESHYVFLQQNRIHERLSTLIETAANGQVFHIAETGFGTGLNFLLVADLFLALSRDDERGARLHFTSFEKYPLRPEDLRRAHQHWPHLAAIAERLQTQYPEKVPGFHRLELHPRITLDIVFGDAINTLPDWSETHRNTVDAWFLDGFAPRKNPDMWQPALFRAIAAAMKPAATLATFTATGHVRRGLQAAGIDIQRIPGFGSKREMLRGYLQRLETPLRNTNDETIIIIGDGIAAASLLWSLKDHPADVRLISQASHLAHGASGNPQGAIYPLLQADWTITSEFYCQAFEYARELYQQRAPDLVVTDGVLQLLKDDGACRRARKLLQRGEYPPSLVCGVTQPRASSIAGVPLPNPALFYPTSGWLQPAHVVERLISATELYRTEHERTTHIQLNTQVTQLERQHGKWCVTTNTNASLHAEHVILANGQDVNRLLPQTLVPIRPVRGQVTQIKPEKGHPLLPLKTVICHQGYVTPALNGSMCIGATFDKKNSEANTTAADNQANLTQLEEGLGVAMPTNAIVGERASIRATTPDHLPVVGRVPFLRFSLLKDTNDNGSQLAELPNCWMLSGLGARGFTSAPLAAEILACELQQRPMPIGQRLKQALAPKRFAERALARNQDPLQLR